MRLLEEEEEEEQGVEGQEAEAQFVVTTMIKKGMLRRISCYQEDHGALSVGSMHMQQRIV